MIVLNGLANCKPYPFTENTLGEDLGLGPQVVVIAGENDKMNTMETSMECVEGMRRAGYRVEVVKHDGGHSFPMDKTVLGGRVKDLCKSVEPPP